MVSKQVRGCFSCICFLPLVVIMIWVSYRRLSPTCSIEEFDVFALHNSPNNHTLHYDLKLKNRNFNLGVYYDALNLTFYYKPAPNRDNFPIGNATIEAFYQGYWKSTHHVGDIEPNIGVNLENAFVGSDDAAGFMVKLATKVRFKRPLWKSKRRSLVVGADLRVNGQGSLIKIKGKNGIKLSNASARRMIGWIEMVGILGISLFIHLV